MILLAVACKKVEPAPKALDDLLHYVWERYDGGTDEELAEALVNLDRAVDAKTLEDPIDGSVSRLSADEAALVGVTDRDPALAAGVFMARDLACGFGQLEEILSYGRQDELYEGVYDAYGRTFDGSRDEWLAARTARLDYGIDYTASLLGTSYDAYARGALRRVGPLDDDQTPWGAFVVQRSYMPDPATFEDGSDKSTDQDYQLEVYWPRGPGDRVLHVYGLWRQANFGSGFDSEDEGTQRILLNELIAWDDDTERLCEEGRP